MRQPRQITDSVSGASFLMLLVLALITSAITVFGCAWPGTSHSVRFNDYQTEREMGRLPPLPTMANGLNEGRAYWDEYDNGDGEWYWEKAEKKTKEVDALW